MKNTMMKIFNTDKVVGCSVHTSSIHIWTKRYEENSKYM